jgi:predicted Rossmann-fold nucleotide-binding protein
MLIAVIGSRSIAPDSVYGKAIASLCRQIAGKGHTIVTGGAKGVDQIAMANSNQCIVYIPWASYERDAVAQYATEVVVFNPNVHVDWTASVGQHHPAPERLSRGAFALHARNYGIIQHADCVIALPGADNLGGTGQGMRLADSLGIPCFNMRNKSHIKPMLEFLNRRV